jgi:MEDS: MEthanogen/methylotroph, DcmR Sensory domain
MLRGEDVKTKDTIHSVDLAPSQHILQFYSSEDELLETLSTYVSDGLSLGESAIVIATPEHLRALRYRLEDTDTDLMRAMFEDRYITLEASVALTSFMVDDVPDERMFGEMARSLLRRASANDRRVRAFGEMVALLWAQGKREATVRLEKLWEDFCRAHAITLLCSYPKAAFADGVARRDRQAEAEIRAAHTLSL